MSAAAVPTIDDVVVGVYRGEVVRNVDEMGQGRLLVKVPALTGDECDVWAMPCSPYAGSGLGMFGVPPVGAKVWVAPVADDSEMLVVLGCYWPARQSFLSSPNLALERGVVTDNVSVRISDVPGAGGLTLEVAPPAVVTSTRIAVTANGVEISVGNSTIVLDGVRVSINGDALQVA